MLKLWLGLSLAKMVDKFVRAIGFYVVPSLSLICLVILGLRLALEVLSRS